MCIYPYFFHQSYIFLIPFSHYEQAMVIINKAILNISPQHKAPVRLYAL